MPRPNWNVSGRIAALVVVLMAALALPGQPHTQPIPGGGQDPDNPLGPGPWNDMTGCRDPSKVVAQSGGVQVPHAPERVDCSLNVYVCGDHLSFHKQVSATADCPTAMHYSSVANRSVCCERWNRGYAFHPKPSVYPPTPAPCKGADRAKCVPCVQAAKRFACHRHPDLCTSGYPGGTADGEYLDEVTRCTLHNIPTATGEPSGTKHGPTFAQGGYTPGGWSNPPRCICTRNMDH